MPRRQDAPERKREFPLNWEHMTIAQVAFCRTEVAALPAPAGEAVYGCRIRWKQTGHAEHGSATRWSIERQWLEEGVIALIKIDKNRLAR
jgi:hypothetical protein